MAADAQTPAYLDTSLPVAQRVADLVGRLTLDEKISQMLWRSPAVERLNIPEYNWWNECLHGVGRAGRATVFPQSIGMAATFNEPLVHRVASAISDEARAKHHQALRQGNRGWYFGLTYWTPNINIFRDPRWGRGQETYGECPFLTARMGVAFCKGLQGDDPNYLKLVATPKHYAVHSGPEADRHSFDAVVNQRDLRETYLPAFKACVQEAKAHSIMGAYNRTNGEACCASITLLQNILRDEWGFDGYVVSDCGAICDIHQHHKITKSPAESAALAVKNGCELNCGEIYHHLNAAVQAGLIDEKDIDLAVTRLFTARFRLGMFDPPERVPYASIDPSVVACDEHRRLSREMARESMVLLKNDGLLPLPKSLANITVAGPTAQHIRPLQGNYFGHSPQLTTIHEGIIGAVEAGTQVEYLKGVDVGSRKEMDEGAIKWFARDADVIIAVMGYTPDFEGEEGEASEDAHSEGGGDRAGIGLPGVQEDMLGKVLDLGKPVVLVLTGGSPIALPEWALEKLNAVVMAWYPGEAGGEAVADVLFGDYNPAGRLPVTFYRSLDQCPPFTDYNMAGRTYRFMSDEPLFRFGYGLSYTTFAYDNLRLSEPKIGPDECLAVSVEVTNTGRRAGDEVVQCFISDVQASVPVPLRQLAGFQRMHLMPGETRTVAFTLKPEQFCAYDDSGNPFIEAGEFRISMGGGQPDDPAGGALTTTLAIG